MNIIVEAELRIIRPGVEARAFRFGLVGHGLDEQDALEVMTSSVRAWCMNLYGLGLLEKALKRRSVDWSGDPAEPPEVEVRVVEPVP